MIKGAWNRLTMVLACGGFALGTLAFCAVPQMPRYRFENFTTANGLPNNHVYSVLVDGGRIWAGTDDGNLQVSQDAGQTFTNVAANLPGLPAGNMYWVSRIDASHFDAATAYVSVDGHRSDDLKPYVFVTHDYGKTFANISNNLPSYGNVQVVREDPKNPNLLFVGTEFGLYTSLDAGRSWGKFMGEYPTVRTDDILIHPRDGDLIVATHGRSVWIADDITPLEQFTPQVAAQDAALFDVRPAVAWVTDFTTEQQLAGEKVFVGKNAPRGTAIDFYLKSATGGDVTVAARVLSVDGHVVGGLSAADRLRDLVPFSVSPRYSEVRRALGIAVRTSQLG